MLYYVFIIFCFPFSLSLSLSPRRPGPQLGERWVWGGQRPPRQIDPSSFPSFLPPPSPPAPASSSLLAPSASSLSPRRRAAPKSSFSVAAEARPLGVSPLVRLQGPLVFRPLPIDISKLPLETSEPRESLEGSGHPRNVPLAGLALTQDLSDGGALNDPGHGPFIGVTKTHLETQPNFRRPSTLRQPEVSSKL